MKRRKQRRRKREGRRHPFTLFPKTSRVLKLRVSQMSMTWNPHRPSYQYAQEVILLITMQSLSNSL